MKWVSQQPFNQLNFLTSTKSSRDEKLLINFYDSSLITISSDFFTAYPNVEYLNLGNCAMQYINQNTFENSTNLLILILNTNRISTLENSTFNGAVKLRALDLSTNFIQDIPTGVFSKLTKLKEISLKNNLIKNLDESTFSSLKQLATLNLADNQLGVIRPNLFSQNTEIVEIDLSNNKIINVEYSILKLNKLKFLTMTGNGLTKFENYPESVKILDIQNNKLTKLFINKNVVRVKAEGNPINKFSVVSYDTLTELYIDVSTTLLYFPEINKFTNLDILGEQMKPAFVNDDTRWFMNFVHFLKNESNIMT